VAFDDSWRVAYVIEQPFSLPCSPALDVQAKRGCAQCSPSAMFRVQQFINRARYYRSPPLQWRSANVQHAHLEFGSRVFCSYNHSGRAPREYGSGRDTFSGSKIAFQAWESILHFDHDLMKIVVRFFRGVRSAAEGRQGPLSENFAFLPFFQILADCNLKFQSIVWQFWHLKKLSKNKDEILYSNHCFEKSYLNFVCSTSYLPPYKIYLETNIWSKTSQAIGI